MRSLISARRWARLNVIVSKVPMLYLKRKYSLAAQREPGVHSPVPLGATEGVVVREDCSVVLPMPELEEVDPGAHYNERLVERLL